MGESWQLTGADRFWLRMDSPTNLMMISGVMLFDEPLDLERLREVVRQRLLPIPRFLDRVVVRSGGAVWERSPSFDLADHVMPAHLPEPGDEAALREFVSRLMSTPLDFSKPLWEFHVVESFRGGSALVGRFHHCMGDGMGLMMVLLALTDLQPGASPAESNPFFALFGDAVNGVARARTWLAEIMPEGMKLLLRPVEAFRELRGARRLVASATALTRLTFRSPDARTSLNDRLGVAKRAAWSEKIGLEEVRKIGDALGGTVNDVLLTAMAGALRRYLVERDGPDGCRDFRATVPVNLRPIEQMSALGNEFGLVYLTIPVEIEDPLERLTELRRRMHALKRSAESLVSLQVIRWIGRLPKGTQRLLVQLFASKATAVVTNVPGPNRILYLADRPIRDMLFWVPRSARLSLGISILSYAGGVRMGVATDAGLVPDPERLVGGFRQELELLKSRARPS